MFGRNNNSQEQEYTSKSSAPTNYEIYSENKSREEKRDQRIYLTIQLTKLAGVLIPVLGILHGMLR